MSDMTPFTRREFLCGSLAIISTIASVPTFLRSSATALAAPANDPRRPGKSGQNILVVIQLSGGNDGLNAVVPYGFDDYYKARPALGIDAKTVLSLDDRAGVGLNPALADFKALIDQGQAGVIQGVGYPNPNRSHFASMDIWHTADPERGSARGTGWLGRALDDMGGKVSKTKQAEGPSCVCIGNDSPLAAEGKLIKPVTFDRVESFRWAGRDLHPALAEAYDVVNRDAAAAAELPLNDQSQLPFVLRTAMNAQLASDRIRAAVAKGTETAFPNGQLANQLRMVASMIRAELPTRVYYVALGGFDTHSGQAGRQNRLLSELGKSLKAFYDEMAALGQAGRVMTLAFSEFGRRVEQNASQGTDHGTAGPVFVAGPMVNAGLIGKHPSLAAGGLDHGDLVHAIDFRAVYAEVLDGWLGVESKTVLGAAYGKAGLLRA